MFNEAAYETLEAFGESNEWNEAGEYSERSRGRGRVLPRPNSGNAAAHAPQPGYATKAELEATANRLDGRIATNTKAIDLVNGRVSSLGTAHNRLETNVKREIEERKTVTDGLKQQVENMKMAVMLTPLLSSPKTTELTLADSTKVKVLIDDGDTFRTMMPILLMSGGFGMGGGTSGSSGSGGSSMDMMLPLMLLTMSKK